MKPILVTGATGRAGRHVVSQLLSLGLPVRALTRRPETAALPPQVDVMRGDLTLPETFDPCLEGVDAVFLVWTAPPATVPAVVDRIARSARRIVFLSSPYKTDHPLFQAAQPNPISLLHADIERRLQASGRDWTFVRPGMFSANALWWWAPQIRSGACVRWPYALVPTAPVHEADIAAVAVRALTSSACAGAEYLVTGPQSLTHRDQVGIIGDVLGRPLRYQEVDADEWRRELPPDVPLGFSHVLLKVWGAALGHPALVTSTVAEVTGTPARTFRDWVVENAAAFQLRTSAH